MDGPLEWIAAVGTMCAAALVAADLGRRITGYGFVLFCAVSAIWIIAGLLSAAIPIVAMNAVLLTINLWGLWQYLLSPKNRRVMERMEPLRNQVEAQVEREMTAEEHARVE